MSVKNWAINNIPTNQWNTVTEVLPGEDCLIFSYKILNRGSGNANVLFALSRNSLTALAPSGLSISNIGTAGTTTYSYRITVVNSRGESTPCDAVTTETGAAVLNSTNFNRLTWNAVTGAVFYRIYGRTNGIERLIGEVDGDTLTFDDIGDVTPTTHPPTVNTTHIVFRFVQQSFASNSMINSENERISLSAGDTLQIFVDGTFVDVIVFGDLVNL